jgi:hypothetical protein
MTWPFSAELARRVGAPVCVRGYLQATADHGLLAGLVAEAVEAAGAWFGSPLVRLYAQGGERDGYATALAEYAGGQTAIFTAEALRQEAPRVLLLLIGNHGSAQFEDSPALLRAVRGSRAIEAAIRQSLETGKVVSLAA